MWDGTINTYEGCYDVKKFKQYRIDIFISTLTLQTFQYEHPATTS